MIATLPFPIPLQPKLARTFGSGFVYWIAFLLVLLPDNLSRASRAGLDISLIHEALRIGGAAALGAAVAPLVIALDQRFPLTTQRAWRHAAIHLAVALLLAVFLVLVSCLLAAWAFEGRMLPSAQTLRAHLASNWALLAFAIGGLDIVLHAWPRLRGVPTPTVTPPPKQPALQALPAAGVGFGLTEIAVTVRGASVNLPLADVDWIETQGNYVGLHVGPSVHLVRSTLQALETQLDPERFVRVHRCHIVALDRVTAKKAMANGDANLILRDGQCVRLSRNYREAFLARWQPCKRPGTSNPSTGEAFEAVSA
ncbi:MAG: LytTR family transcriptional regulator [Betaproteobacteria bacterium]|nr:LytTR family transcriptional regulator [Betaproteobacteria bacterium]